MPELEMVIPWLELIPFIVLTQDLVEKCPEKFVLEML